MADTEVERSIYFYAVEMADGQEWRRVDVLRGLDELDEENRAMPLGQENYVWAEVDRIPRAQEAGRLRLFKDRRSNLPGYALHGNIGELPIPDEAGLVEPTHVVLGGDGLIAAEFNNAAPRISTQFAALLREKLNLDLLIGTYVQGSIMEQLDRLEEIQLLEFSLVATPQLEDELRNAGPFGDAAIELSRADHGRRLNLKLTGDKHSESWGSQALSFAKRVLGMPSQEHVAKVLRIKGYDPASENVEVVDLIKQRLVRRVQIEKSTARCKALDVSKAYQHIEEAMREVRKTDLPNARVIL